MQRGKCTDKVLQPRTGTAEDQRQVRACRAREFQGDAAAFQACGETHRPDPIQQLHRRHVERQPQCFRCADRAVERGIEIRGTVAAERLRRIDQQTLRMDQTIVQRHAVQKRLEGRTRRTPGLHHVDIAQPLLVAECDRTDVGTRLHRRVVDHQQRCRGTRRQIGEIAGDALLEAALQRCIEAGGDPRCLRVRDAQALCQQGRIHRWTQPARDHAFDPRILHLCRRPCAGRGHARQQLVACDLGRIRRAIRSQAAGCLRQDREQRGFRMREAQRGLAEIGPTRGLHPFDGAAEWRAFQVQREDVAFRKMRFELQRTQQLPQFSPWRARARSAQPRVDDACDLHRQRRAAGHDPPAPQQLPGRTQQGDRIDAGVPPEPAVLVTQQRLHIQRRDLLRRGRIAPHAFRIREGAQRAAVARSDQHAGIAMRGQRQREQQVQQQQRGQQRHRAPAQHRKQQDLAPSPACGRGLGWG